MFLELSVIKKHLIIEDEFTEDDDYLMQLAEVAETVVQKHIDSNLNDIVEAEGALPKPLLQAMLLMVGNLYNSREIDVFGVSAVEIPKGYDYLLSLYKNYNNTKMNS